MKRYNITIATPLFPPDIGGPALYAEMFSRIWSKEGHMVSVVHMGGLRKFPTGLRHILYFIKLIPACIKADAIFVLDTLSVALPAMILGHMLRKKVIVRVGGDFLWETYINRTHEHILLSEFYNEERKLTFKENTIFDLTNFVFQYVDHVVFSTEWQKEICLAAYSLDAQKVSVIANAFPDRAKRNIVPKNRIILSPSRNIFLKNKHGLEKAFVIVKERFFDPVLDTAISTHEELLKRISEAYMVVVPSFSEVSPNVVLDAVSLGVPVVATEDCGIKEHLSDVVVWVNPKDPQSIASGIELLMDAKTYSEYMARISKFSYTRSEEDVACDFLNLI